MMGVRNFSGFALILLTVLAVSHIANSDKLEDLMQDTIDELVQDLADRYAVFEPDEFWHPYVYGTGNENREVMHVQDVEQISISGDYFQWKYARLGLKHFIIGLSTNSFDLFGSDFKKISSTASPVDLEALAVYARWNDEHSHSELIILAVTSEPRLNVYEFDGQSMENIGSFPLHYPVKDIEFVHAASSTKVIIVPKEEDVDIDIYNVEVSNTTQVWFFQRITSAAGSPNVAVYDSDMLESTIAVARVSQIDIYTYDSKAGLFDISQSITMPNSCRNLFSFTLSYQNFIGCVPVDPNLSVRFISYNHNTNEYVLEDQDETFGKLRAVEVYPVAVADYRDEYFLLVQDTQNLTYILMHHGRQAGFQIEYTCDIEDNCPQVVDLSRGIGFPHNESTAYVFPAVIGSEKSEVFLIKKEIRDSLSPLVAESRKLYNNFYDLSKRFEDWERGVISVTNALNKSVRNNEPNVITMAWDLKSLSSLYVNVMLPTNEDPTIFEEFKFLGEPWTEEDFKTDIPNIGKELNVLSNRINAARIELKDAVFQDSVSIQLITAAQNVSGNFEMQNLTSTFANSSLIKDSRNTNEFLNSLLLLSDEIQIQSTVIFETELKTTELNTSKLNDIFVSHIARLSQENQFECTIQFQGNFSVEKNLNATTINGMSLADLVTADNISGFHFVDGFVIRNDTTSGGFFSFDNVLLKSTDQVILSHVSFTEVQTLTQVTVGLMDGNNFTEFASSVITSNYSGIIRGVKTIEEVVETNTLDITESWNGLQFPSSFIFNQQKKVIIQSSKSFSNITTDKVTISGHLDGVDPSLFISRTLPMEFNSTWTFLGPVEIIKDIPVSGTVDGVLMEQLNNKGTLDEYRESYVAYGDVEFEQEIVVETLLINSNVNNQQFEEAFGHLMLFNGSTCKVPGITTVSTNISLENLVVDSGVANNFKLDNLLTVNDDQNITANIILTEPCQFGVLCALDLYDTVDLKSFLNNTVRLTGVSKVAWKTNFEYISCGSSLVIDSPINLVSQYGTSVAVTSGREFQTFFSDISFQQLVMKNLVVDGNVTTTGSNFGGIDVNNWNSSRLSLSKDEHITFEFKVDGLVKVSSAIFTQILNDVSLPLLFNSTLRTNKLDQTFIEHIKLEGLLAVKDGIITFQDEINDFSLDNLVQNGFPLNSTEEDVLQLDGDWHFEAIKVSGSLLVQGETCGVDLNALDSDSVRKEESGILISGRNILNVAQVEKNITANTIKDKPTADLFTLNGSQSISCPFNFLKNVTVNGNLSTNGFLNEMSTALLGKAHSKTAPNVHVIDGNYKSQHLITMESLNIDGEIQGKDFSALVQDLIPLNATDLQFLETKIFSAPVTIGGDVDTSLYNQISPHNFRNMKLKDNATLKNPTFKSSVHVDLIEVSDGDVNAKNILGILWDDLITQTIQTINPTQSLNNLTFDRIIVQSFFSVDFFQGIPFSNFIPLNTSQEIDSLRIRKAIFHGTNIPVGGLVSGFNLQQEFEDTLMSNMEPPGQISGNKSFVGTVTITSDLTCFGPNFKDQVVDITKPFNISTPVEFIQPVHVDKNVNVTEPVNGHTVNSIIAEALTQGDTQPITGEWEFIQGVTFKEDVSGPGELENYNLQKLIDQKNIEIRAAEDDIARHKQRYREECYRVYNLTEDLGSNPMKLDSFDKHQSIILKKKVEKVVTVRSAEKLFLLTASSSCEIIKYEWKFSTELFYKEISSSEKGLKLGHVKEWASATYGHLAFLVYSAQDSECSSIQEGLYFLLLQETGQFSPVYSLMPGTVKTFKIISDEETQKLAIFVISNENVLQVLTWNKHESQFQNEFEMEFETSYHKIELVNYKHGVGVLLVSDNEVAIYHYAWHTKTLSLQDEEKFLTGKGDSLGIFESYDELYGIIPQKGIQLSNLLTTYTLQVFRTMDTEIRQLQQLPLQDVVSLTVMNFSKQIYVSFLSKSVGLSIYKFMGLNGLQRLNVNPIKIFHGHQVHSFDVKAWTFSASRPFLLVLTATSMEIYHGNVYGDSLSLNSNALCRVN